MAEVFLDTAYAIALSSANDHFHQRAVVLANELEAAGRRLVTTHARCVVGNQQRPVKTTLSQRGYPTAGRPRSRS